MMEQTRAQALEWVMKSLPLKREACGVVIVENGKEAFVPCKNLSELDDQFILDPADYYSAEKRGEITRIVHSHVYSPAKPSEADKVSCEASGLPWSIVSIPTGTWFDFQPTGYKADLVGRQWAHGVLDCYSIIRDYYKQILAIDLPDFDRSYEWWLKGQNLYVDHFTEAGFYEIPIEQIDIHDVVLMRINSPVINHGAVYHKKDQIIHHLHRRLSSRDVYGGYYRKHTEKVLRHKHVKNSKT
jgi:proteasome lid subunit RPN8/RPN11